MFSYTLPSFRELAVQIYEVLLIFSHYFTSLKLALFVGGTNITENITSFQEHGGNIIVGTPGRIIDFTNRMTKHDSNSTHQSINFKKLEVLILDEADKLLDMGFKDSLNQIFSFLPKQRRTGLFSATQTKEVTELARAGLRNPVNVTVKVQSNSISSEKDGKFPSTSSSSLQQSIPSSLDNYYMICEYEERPYHLLHFISCHLHDKIIIFCATCACVDYYAAMFNALVRKHSSSAFSSTAQEDNKLQFPSSISFIPFHGKMIPKKRTALFQKFKSLTSGGVMFSTDVAARGIDIPDVDWIIQMAAPKDPSFFVHRIGRTARAGKKGGAILYITKEEEPYIELLRGRGVPLKNSDDPDSELGLKLLSHPASFNQSEVFEMMKGIARKDRDILEAGSSAFVAFMRAYKENLCSFIFQLEQLDIGSVARSYGLLRLPKIAETRGVKGKPIVFDTDRTDTSTIPYKHSEKEKARVQRLTDSKQTKQLEKEESRTSKKEQKGKSEWVPAEEFVRTDKKRERKRKQSTYSKLKEEWDELAAEETLYKKFKKGKISKGDYESSLFSDRSPEENEKTSKSVSSGKNDSDDESNQSESD
jgi:ATP-dependent RNA helicase DDX55/SPB4